MVTAAQLQKCSTLSLASQTSPASASRFLYRYERLSYVPVVLNAAVILLIVEEDRAECTLVSDPIEVNLGQSTLRQTALTEPQTLFNGK